MKKSFLVSVGFVLGMTRLNLFEHSICKISSTRVTPQTKSLINLIVTTKSACVAVGWEVTWLQLLLLAFWFFLQFQKQKKNNIFFFAIVDLVILSVCLASTIFTPANTYCNYPLTTTQDDRFISCENIVSRSQTSCPLPHPLSHFLGLYPSYSSLLLLSWTKVQTHVVITPSR